MLRSFVRLSFGAILWFFIGPVRADALDPAAIDAIVKKSLDAWHGPGVAVAIVRDGEVIYLKGHGVKSLDWDEPTTGAFRFID